MDKLIIEGGRPLRGNVKVSGAKNACLPIMAAALLTDEECELRNVPSLRDVDTMIMILKAMGVKCLRTKNIFRRQKGTYHGYTAPYEIVSTMRASIAVLGPLLARKGRAKVSFPGGCIIGPRPIDLHLKGLRALGVDLTVEGGYIIARADRLKGADIYLGGHFGSSVLATANVMMIATLAKGTTVIHNAACEPEVKDLADFLVKMGAQIEGQATPTIRINGVKSLHGASHTVIPDRIETGTYMIASAITSGDIEIEGANPGHVMALMDKMREAGCLIEAGPTSLRVKRKRKSLTSISLSTHPYPGFPTDMQAQMMSMAAVSKGISVITEKVYPERFIHISELNRMGASIILEGPNAIINGVRNLSGADVMASDLRASAALVLAGLVAKGRTVIHRVYHLDRGYESIERKLGALGAKIKRINEK